MVVGGRKLICGVLLSVLMLPALALSAAAAEEPFAITSGDVLVLRLRAAPAGMSVQERAVIIYERLGAILRDPAITAADIRAVKLGNEAVVMGGKQLFITVIPADAAANDNTDPMVLAAMWASNLRHAWLRTRPLPPPPAP